jgi:hypothetical protein
VKEITDAHVVDTDKTRELQARENPVTDEYFDDEA